MPIARSAVCAARTRRCRIISSTRRPCRPRTTSSCRRRCSAISTARSRRRSTCRPTSRSSASRTSTRRPMRSAARAARPIGRTRSPARSCRRGPRRKPRRRTARRAPKQPELPLPAPPPPSRPADVYEAGGVVYMTQPLSRPEALPGQTYKVHWPDSEHALYITLNDIVQDGRRRPFEIFINSKNMEHYAWTVALTRMISAVFRRGGDVSFVVEEMKAVFDPRGGAWMDGPLCALAARRDRRRHRTAHDRDRLPAAERPRRRAAIEARVVDLDARCRRRQRRGRAVAGPRLAAMPEMRRGGADPPRRLRPMHELRLLEMRLA